jgi:hypothetical protein
VEVGDTECLLADVPGESHLREAADFHLKVRGGLCVSPVLVSCLDRDSLLLGGFRGGESARWAKSELLRTASQDHLKKQRPTFERR